MKLTFVAAYLFLVACVLVNAVPTPQNNKPAHAKTQPAKPKAQLAKPKTRPQKPKAQPAKPKKKNGPPMVSASAQVLPGGMTNLEVDQMLCLINQRRARDNLPPLAVHKGLMKSAQSHSEYQARIKRMSHSDPLGDKLARISKFGFKPQTVGENVAYDQKTIPQVVNAWFNSTIHVEVITGNYVYVGFGLKDNAWTQHFGTPLYYDGKNGAKPPPPQCPGLSLELSTNIKLHGLLALTAKAQIDLSLGAGAVKAVDSVVNQFANII